MSEFRIPDKAQQAADDTQQEGLRVVAAGVYRQESRGYGFVCFECRCEVDIHRRGPHREGCSMRTNNESLLPGAEDFSEFVDKPVGFYHGHDATPTERVSGVRVEADNMGPLRKGGAGHKALYSFRGGDRMTAYDASVRTTGDFHAVRREATRLMVRGFLVKDGTLPNQAPRGRPHVDAYRITDEGIDELSRLGGSP